MTASSPEFSRKEIRLVKQTSELTMALRPLLTKLNLAKSRLATMEAQHVPPDSPSRRSAVTQIKDAAGAIDAIVRGYGGE